MINTVVFDMDGVLFDTERLCLESWLAIAGQHGIPDMEEFFPKCIGRNNTDTRALVLEHYGADFPYEKFCRETSRWFHDWIEQNGLPVKEGVRELLQFLRDGDWNVGIASSSRCQSVVNHLERAGIRDAFSVIIGGDMVEHSKPRPEIYLTACERLHALPSECYAIEDSPNGIRAAYRAGMRPIMVPDLVPPDAEMEQLAHIICRNLREVQRYLAQSLY